MPRLAAPIVLAWLVAAALLEGSVTADEAAPATPSSAPAPSMNDGAAADAPVESVPAGATAAPSDSATGAPRDLPELPRPSERLHFRFTADAWFPRLDGNTRYGGATFDLGDQFDLNNSEAIFDGFAQLNWQRWELSLSGFSFSTNGNAVAGAPFVWGDVSASTGDALQSSFSLDSVAFEVGYALFRPLADQPWPWSERVRNERNTVPGTDDYRGDLSFVPYIGARWFDIDQSLLDAANGDSARYSSNWLAAYAGLRLELSIRMPKQVPFLDRLVISAGGAYGGVFAGGDGSYLQVRAGLDLYFTPNLALSAGYQLIELNADDDSFTFDGGLQGVWVGATLWF
ncbi:MAG: hypothetical protein U0575_02325 [Phycisphaerales bacterium]